MKLICAIRVWGARGSQRRSGIISGSLAHVKLHEPQTKKAREPFSASEQFEWESCHLGMGNPFAHELITKPLLLVPPMLPTQFVVCASPTVAFYKQTG